MGRHNNYSLKRGWPKSSAILFGLIAALLGLMGPGGCASHLDSGGLEPIQEFKDPETAQPYLLYRPTRYDRNKDWPLMVVCASGFPDSPSRRIEAWTDIAEARGFLVLVPTVKATTGTWAPKLAKYQPLQREDERHVLACVQHVRAGHSISPDRIFMQGVGSGAACALYIGLKHPDLFRAIDISNPKFHGVCMGEVAANIDPYQPVQVHYPITDKILGRHGKNCEEWLRSNGADLREDRPGPHEAGSPSDAVGFFEDVLRSVPWLRVRTSIPDPKQPRQMRFLLESSVEPTEYLWDFGDGKTSPVASPLHEYAKPGLYRATVTATLRAKGAKGVSQQRSAEVVVP